jgi:methyl-accepting chemotaxis protein
MNQHSMTIQKWLILGFAFGPAALAIIGWLAYSNTAALADRRDLSQHTYEVLREIGNVRTAIVDAETGMRGFALTGNESFLDVYTRGRDAIQPEVDMLAMLTADNAAQQSAVQQLRTAVGEELRFLADAIDQRRLSFDAALRAIAPGTGKANMDRIRDVLAGMEREETRLLGLRDSEAQRIEQTTFDTILYGTILTFLILIAAGIFILRMVTAPIRGAIQALTASSAEILTGATQQAAGMRQQNSAVAETVATVDEVLQTSEQAAQRARVVAESAQRATEAGHSGRQAVLDTVASMDEVKSQSSSIAESILALSERAQAIGEIIAAVNEIAEQTNLLALNAAIEASRAGEHGRGFSVVAGEIKTLADQSKKATTQIRTILGEIQKSTNTAVMVTEEGTKSVQQAIQAANEAGSTITVLVDMIAEAAQSAMQITASAGQQATGMSQIHQAMSQIKETSVQNLAATRQAEQAAQNLHVVGTRLKAMVVGGR